MIKAVIFDLGNTLADQNTWVRYPETIHLLESLKGVFRLGLITNAAPWTKRDEIIKILDDLEIGGYFEHVIVSSEIGIWKPNHRIFDEMLKALDVSADECVMVGNTISTDIFGGNRAGMETVLLQNEPEYVRSEWENPDHTIRSLSELESILQIYKS